ncbi:MAG: lytic transglycosylase F [Desulfobacterium sp.]|nr:lytic transglycosylase F [Desulfobacterium sp.]
MRKTGLKWVILGYILLKTAHAFAGIDTSLIDEQKNRKRWTGDYAELVQHRVIRALVPYSKTYFFLDKATPRGVTHDLLMEFEKTVNTQLERRHLKVHVVIIPTPRDRLIPDLASGLGDIAAGNLTITGGRRRKVDFTVPFMTQVKEILVTGPESPRIYSVNDLAGKPIMVRKSSSYYDSLLRLNRKFRATGKKRVRIVKAHEYLEDEDLLEMLDAGMIPMLVVDNHKAELWSNIFDNIVIYPHIAIRTSGQIAWAIRKNSPELATVLNDFIQKNKRGTLLGNIIFERYLKNTRHVRNTFAQDKKFSNILELFKKYAEEYNFDWLLLKAIAFQESGINQKITSSRGAVGVMQLMPATAGDPNVNIPDITGVDANIHAGSKYLRFLIDRYFTESDIDLLNRNLLGLAAYNAGPRRVSNLRAETKKMGLDPNVWFQNVEVVAARQIGRETVQYVSNIFKYYIAYRLIQDQENLKQSN